MKKTTQMSAILGQNVVKIPKEVTCVSVHQASEKTTAFVKVSPHLICVLTPFIVTYLSCFQSSVQVSIFVILSLKLLHLKILTYRQTTFTDSICQEQHFCAEGF